jgi:hypothetical protein
MQSEAIIRHPEARVMLPADSVLALRPDDVVSLKLAETVFGLTRKAMEGKIYRGQWVVGRQYHRDPDGGIWIDCEGVRKWVRGER